MADSDRLDPNELLQKIRQVCLGEADEIPPGYRSGLEWAKDWNMSVARATTLLREASEKGVLGRKLLRVHRPIGIRYIGYFGPLPKKDKK